MDFGTEVKIPCRISYAHVAEPKQGPNGSARYSCTLLIDKTDEATIEAVRDAINEAKRQGLERKWDGHMPEDIREPLRDGDEQRPDDPAYAGCMFLTATSPNPPTLVDQKTNIIQDRSTVYSGCYCNVVVDMFAFKSSTIPGVYGIAAELEYIQLVRQGESLQGRGSIMKWFKPVATREEE